jgi:Transposase
VIGIDEWSRRKGSDFGSIIVDLERRQVFYVLPDRAASSVEAWMRNHPDIEYVVRDRDGLYAGGVTKGAPQAKSVAAVPNRSQQMGPLASEGQTDVANALRDAVIRHEDAWPKRIHDALARQEPARVFHHQT